MKHYLAESRHRMYVIACRAAVDVLAAAAPAGDSSWKLEAAGERQVAAVDNQAQGSIQGCQRCRLCFLTCFLCCARCTGLSCWICRTRRVCIRMFMCICICICICLPDCSGCCCACRARSAVTAMAANKPVAVLCALHGAAAVWAAS
jgi:hypothetical protein